MGKGDRRTRRGKIFSASYGKCRSQKSNEPSYQSTTPAREANKPAAKTSGATKKATPKKSK